MILKKHIKDVSMFFAFSTSQFEENKTQLQEGEKYVSLGAGAYIPKNQVENYLSGFETIDKWYKMELKKNKLRRQHIAFELANYESYYSNDIEDAMEALGNEYSRQEVLTVFIAERKKQILADQI